MQVMDVELTSLDCTVYPRKRKYQTAEKYLLKIVVTLITPNIIRLIAPTDKSGFWEASNA